MCLCTVLSQIPATRAFNSCPQTFIQSAFSVPRVFNSFPYVPSLPIPFSPSLKTASYTFYLFVYFYFFFLVKTGEHGMQILMWKQAWLLQKVKTIGGNWKSRMCLTHLRHKIPNSALGPLFWSVQERGAVGRNRVLQEATGEQRHHFRYFSSPQFLPQPPPLTLFCHFLNTFP